MSSSGANEKWISSAYGFGRSPAARQEVELAEDRARRLAELGHDRVVHAAGEARDLPHRAGVELPQLVLVEVREQPLDVLVVEAVEDLGRVAPAALGLGGVERGDLLRALVALAGQRGGAGDRGVGLRRAASLARASAAPPPRSARTRERAQRRRSERDRRRRGGRGDLGLRGLEVRALFHARNPIRRRRRRRAGGRGTPRSPPTRPVGERAEPQRRAAVLVLLAHGRVHVHALEPGLLLRGAGGAARAVVARVDPEPPALDRPDRELVGRERRPGLGGSAM